MAWPGKYGYASLWTHRDHFSSMGWSWWLADAATRRRHRSHRLPRRSFITPRPVPGVKLRVCLRHEADTQPRCSPTDRYSPGRPFLPNGPICSGGDSIILQPHNAIQHFAHPNPTRSSTETYNAQTQAWTGAGNMSTSRSGHSAVLRLDGRVLVSAGSTTDFYGLVSNVPPPLAAVNDSLSTKQATPLSFSGAQLHHRR